MLLGGLTALLLAGVAIVGTGERSEARAAACTTPTFKFYPGSTIARARYGEVDYSFEVCSGTSPQSWKAYVSRATTNSTGDNLGFSISGTSIPVTSGGDFYRFYDGQIHWKTCTPRVGWPCVRSGVMHIKFYAYDVDGTPRVQVLDTNTGDPGFTLYTTP
jgi:hypothetical protein